MPSQTPDFPPVPFSATYPHQSFRLLELPPELASLIERPNGQSTRLVFKSSPATSSKISTTIRNDEASGQGYLHLCSDERAWAVKQVSTSNSVYITQTERPCAKRRRIEDEYQSNGDSPMSVDGEENTVCNEEGQAGISTISQVSNILELIEVKTDEGEVERSVRDMVPLYPDDDEDEEVRTEIGRVVQLRDLLDDIPAPMTAILAAAQKLFVFTSTDRRKEVEQPVQAVYVPTSTLLLRAWKAFVQQCAISGVKIAGDGLDGAALRNVLAELVVSENDGTVEDKNTGDITAAVVKAILRRFAASNSDSSRAVVDPAANGGLNATPAVTGWKQTEASEHVGRWMLESMRRTESKGKQIRLEDFRRQWSELLPDLWTAESYDVAALVDSVDGVSVARDDPGDQILNFGDAGELDDVLLGLGKGLGRAVPRKTPAATATKVASASAGVGAARNEKKRKWHEKFGAQRAVAAVKR